MAGPPPSPMFHNQGNRPAAAYRNAVTDHRGAQGSPRGHGFGGGRGYRPPSSVPVGGRGYGLPSFTADGRLRDNGQPSFAPDGRLRDYGQGSFARPQDQLSSAAVGGPRLAVGQGQLSFAAVGQGQLSFVAVGGPRLAVGQGPTSFAAEGERFLAGPRGQPPFAAEGGYGPRFAAAGARPPFAAEDSYGPRFPAAGAQPPFPADGERFLAAARGPTSIAGEDMRFAAPRGQPPFPAEGERFLAAARGPAPIAVEDMRFAAPRGQLPFAAEGGYGPRFAAAGAQPLFRAPVVAARQGQPVLSTYSHGVAMEAGGRASHAAGPIGNFKFCDQQVVTITRNNYHSIFQTIKQILSQRSGRLFIGLDLEYVASSSTNISRPYCSTQWYDSLRDFVNGGEIVQLGMVFALDGPSPIPLHAYQLNLQIDATGGQYSQKSIDFLVANKHVLEDYKNLGVFPEWAFAGLIRHMPFNDPSVTWITFHADRDVSFLMRLAVEGGRGMLPHTRAEFLHQVKHFFPVLYDVRVLAQLMTPRYSGSLKKLAEELCVKRSGEEHFAGSDALVTLECFAKIVERFGDQAISTRLGLLSGAEELEMAITCALPLSYSAISISEVTSENFPEQAARIQDTLRSNFNIIAVQVLVPGEEQSLGDSVSPEDRYQRLLTQVNQVAKFEVELCFVNMDSLISYGRVWKLTVDDDHLAHGLARILASSGATHDPNRIWVTLHGSRGIACLLRSFTAPASLPDTYLDYISCRSC